MTLPESGWRGYGAPGHPYSRPSDWHKKLWAFTPFTDLTKYGPNLRPISIGQASANLRAAAIQADDLGHDLREVAFLSWRIRCPDKAADALIALETALVSERRL